MITFIMFLANNADFGPFQFIISGIVGTLGTLLGLKLVEWVRQLFTGSPNNSEKRSEAIRAKALEQLQKIKDQQNSEKKDL